MRSRARGRSRAEDDGPGARERASRPHRRPRSRAQQHGRNVPPHVRRVRVDHASARRRDRHAHRQGFERAEPDVGSPLRRIGPETQRQGPLRRRVQTPARGAPVLRLDRACREPPLHAARGAIAAPSPHMLRRPSEALVQGGNRRVRRPGRPGWAMRPAKYASVVRTFDAREPNGLTDFRQSPARPFSEQDVLFGVRRSTSENTSVPSSKSQIRTEKNFSPTRQM